MINSRKVFYPRLAPSRNIVVVLALFIISATQTFLVAQEDSNHTNKSTSLMLQFYGPEVLGIHINHNASKRISLNLGLGVDLGTHLGANAYLTNRDLKRFAWYGGLQAYWIRKTEGFVNTDFFGSMSTGSSTSDKSESQVGVYFPIGFEYMAKKGFTIQADVGPNLVSDDWSQVNTAPINGSFKIGYTFRPKK